MVAAAQVVIESKECTGPEAYFARLIACDGLRPSRAYTVAWKSKTENAAAMAARILDRPHVAAKIAELRERADAEGIAGLNERRRLLAEKFRKDLSKAKLTHGNQIAAIELDSRLAGDLRPDVLNVAVGVSIGEMLGELSRGVGVIPVASVAVVNETGQKDYSAALYGETAPEIKPATLVPPMAQKPVAWQGQAAEGVLPERAPPAAAGWEDDE